jgi:hypothetical protein
VQHYGVVISEILDLAFIAFWNQTLQVLLKGFPMNGHVRPFFFISWFTGIFLENLTSEGEKKKGNEDSYSFNKYSSMSMLEEK